jgi:hypothetical protein
MARSRRIMTKGRRRLIQFALFALLLLAMCVLLWVVLRIEPVGPKDYSSAGFSSEAWLSLPHPAL